MKHTIQICVAVVACACASAQDFDKTAPKAPPAKPPAVQVGAAPADAAASEEILVPALKAIVVVPTIEAVKFEGLPDAKGIQVQGPAFLRVPEFERLLTPYL